MRLQFIPIHVFRETPSVTFFDAGVSGTNGTDVVVHRGAATSPPDANGFQQYYVHQHQVDHNLVREDHKSARRNALLREHGLELPVSVE